LYDIINFVDTSDTITACCPWMASKVKVSMFLPPGLAQAIKIQAARQGGGVSDLIGAMFTCAHCHEPISDEFVVGKPKLVEPNRYAVLFHGNREACLAASGTKGTLRK
jgi:hypothetical protein